MTKSFKYHKRQFLADAKVADSYANAVVTYEKPAIKKGWDGEHVRKPYANGSIKLTDCYRSITWEFSKDEKGLLKLKKTRAVLDEFFDKLEQAYAYAKEDDKLYTKLKKEFDARTKAKGQRVRRTKP